MTEMRKRILHWLVWRFGADLVIAQNIKIDDGTLVVEVDEPTIIRNCSVTHTRIEGIKGLFYPDESPRIGPASWTGYEA